MAAAFSIAVISPSTALDPGSDLQFSTSLWPNPASDRVHLRVNLGQESTLDFQIVNLQGQTVLESPEAFYLPGEHAFNFDVRNLSSGIYLARFRINGENIVRKLLIE